MLQCSREYQWLLEVDLVSECCDARFQFHRGQEVLFRLVVPLQLRIQRHDTPCYRSHDKQAIVLNKVYT